MRFVLDASFAAAAIRPDEGGEDVDRAFDTFGRTGAAVPDLFWHEIRNVLLIAEREERLPQGAGAVEVSGLRDLPIETRTHRNDADVLRLAYEHRLSAYDAAYLALAIELQLPLATFDGRLRAAADAADVHLVGG